MSTEEKIKILSGVNTVEFFVRSKAMDFVDTVSNIHPLLRLYFDSDLSSDIENNSILAITTAIEKCIGAFTQKDFTTYREIGMTIAYGLHKQLYFAKLIHHFNTKRISAEEFYNLAAEHFAVSTANILNSAWDLIGDKIPEILCAGVESMLVSFGVDPLTAHNVSDFIDGICNVAYMYVKEHLPDEERIKKFIHDTLEETVNTAKALMELTSAAIERSKKFYHQVVSSIKSLGRQIYEFFEWEIPDFLKDEETDAEDEFVEEETVEAPIFEEETVEEAVFEEETVEEAVFEEESSEKATASIDDDVHKSAAFEQWKPQDKEKRNKDIDK